MRPVELLIFGVAMASAAGLVVALLCLLFAGSIPDPGDDGSAGPLPIDPEPDRPTRG